MVRFSVLGPVELRDGQRRAVVGGRRQVALLALLLVNANRALSTDQLIDVLWDDQLSGAPPKRLQMTVVRLRRALDAAGVEGGSVLQTVAAGYMLKVAPGELDAEVFQTRVQEGSRVLERGDVEHARALLDEALGMWGGPAFAQVAYEPFAQPEIRRLEELRLRALKARVECELRLGQHAAAVGELEGLLAAYPGDERFAGQLMLAWYRCGRQGDALDVYARTRNYLSSELGLEPGPALQGLQTEILAHAPTLQWACDERVQAATDDEPSAAPGGAAESARATPIGLALPRLLHPPAGLPFVGRKTELAHLHELWAAVCTGTRAATVVGGEPGIGKTRLASEIARTVHGQGALVLYGRCDEGLAVPYQPFVEALRPYVNAVGRDRVRAELGDLAPELGRLVPELAGLGQPMRADPESERFALFEAVAALIEAMTRHQHALLIIEDLHWATNPTLLLLRHLIRSEQPLGALIVGTYRDTELAQAGHPLAQLLADLHRDASVEHVSIRGLDEAAISAMLDTTTGQTGQERIELTRALKHHTAGNPLFVRELLAELTESGAPLQAAATTEQLQAPERLRHVIGQRVARLSAPAGRALNAAAVAAVASATVSVVLLEHLLGEQIAVLDALEEANAAGLLAEAEHGTYAFSHALVRQTIYNQLSTVRRMRLHRQLGEALETLNDIDTHVEALAYHFTHAAADGQALKAANYALAAGHRATARLGYEEAATHYQRGLQALTLTAQPHDRQRCDLLLALGDTHWREGELDKARRACGQAADLAEKLGDARALAHAALGFCGPHRFDATTTVRGAVADLLQRALAALGEEDSVLRSQLLGRLAIYTNIEQRKRMLAHQALEMARRVADAAALTDVLVSTHWVTRGPDTLHESIAMAEELARVAHAGDCRHRALAHGRLIDGLLELGDIDAVHRELDALQRLAETRQERYVKRLLAAFRASQAYLHGQLEDCERFAHDALAQRFTGHDQPAHTFGLQMFLVRLEQGRLNEFIETVESFATRDPQLTRWRCALAQSHAQLNLTEQARRELEAIAHDDFSDLPHDVLWLANLSALADVVVLFDDAPRAQTLHKLLSPYANRCVVSFAGMCHGSVSRSLGLLATILTRYDDAEKHFQQALRMNTQIKSPLWTAHTQHDYARMLLARSQTADHDRAHQLLSNALATAQELGLEALANKMRSLKT